MDCSPDKKRCFLRRLVFHSAREHTGSSPSFVSARDPELINPRVFHRPLVHGYRVLGYNVVRFLYVSRLVNDRTIRKYSAANFLLDREASGQKTRPPKLIENSQRGTNEYRTRVSIIFEYTPRRMVLLGRASKNLRFERDYYATFASYRAIVLEWKIPRVASKKYGDRE